MSEQSAAASRRPSSARSTRVPFAALASLASILIAASAGAQGVDSRCVAGGVDGLVRQDACQKALDLFAFMAPQLGASITGGNVVLGGGGALGGPGHFSIGLRANVIRGQLPQTDGVSLSVLGAQRSDFRPNRQLLGLPTAEAAIGLFRGIPLGVTNVLGVDALVSAFYVPELTEDDFRLSTDGGSYKFGYGVRVGVLQETAVVPGVSLSVLRRELPTVNFATRIGAGDSISVSDFSASTTSWRLAAAKRFLIVGLSAGLGQDRYDASATTAAYVAPRSATLGGVTITSPAFSGSFASPEQKLTRTNAFAGLSLNLAIVRIAAEVGRVTGGSVGPTYNSFGGRAPDAAYTYGSIGVRLQR